MKIDNDYALRTIADWRRDREFAIAALYDDELYSSGIESALNVG